MAQQLNETRRLGMGTVSSLGIELTAMNASVGIVSSNYVQGRACVLCISTIAHSYDEHWWHKTAAPDHMTA